MVTHSIFNSKSEYKNKYFAINTIKNNVIFEYL